MACYGERLNSVHFHSFEPDFGTPIRRTPTSWWDYGLWSRHRTYSELYFSRYTDRSYVASESARISYNYTEGEADPERKAKFDALYLKANVQVQSAHWSQARQMYFAIQKKKGLWTEDLRDRVDLLTYLSSHRNITPAQISAVKLYNSAVELGLKDKWKLSDVMLSTLSRSPGIDFLKDRISYRRACNVYELNNFAEATRLFQNCADSFPHSPLRESALIMAARTCILQNSPDAKTLEQGQVAMRQLLSSYPHTRFYQSTLGLKARVHFLQKQYSDALWCYYRLGDLESVRLVYKAIPNALNGEGVVRLMEAYLSRIHDEVGIDADSDDIFTVKQINELRNRLSLNLIHKFSEDLKSSPSLLVSYIYYRLYYTNTRFQDLANLAEMARAALQRSPNTTLSPKVEVRLAEVEYQQRHYTSCLDWASRALISDPNYDRALFMRAAAEDKSHRYRAANADLIKVLKFSKDSAIRQSTRQLLALVCEAQGDLSGALDQYYVLGYSIDAAYLLDVRMSPKQIEAYARSCRNDQLVDELGQNESPNVTYKSSYTRRQLLAYTLGIRYTRLQRWRDAERWLTSLPANLRNDFDSERNRYTDDACPAALEAVKDLARLRVAVARSRSYEANAAAAYRFASYYHNHSDLLLYNVMLWRGERVVNFEEFWNNRAQSDADSLAIRNYMRENDVFLRSRELCLGVVAKYPHSKVAPNALYRAACASYRVGALSRWFQHNTVGFRFKPAGEPTALMNRLVANYPTSTLVASATKYGEVFAIDSRHATWPHYASATRQRSPRMDDKINVDVVDAERLLARQ